jgi:hypothetical protein
MYVDARAKHYEKESHIGKFEFPIFELIREIATMMSHDDYMCA